MADVRALLKSRRQEQRITHPYASYTQSGQLRCKACGMIVKHVSAWNGHVGSKGHRTAVAKLKEEEAFSALKQKKNERRSAEEEEEEEEEDVLPAKKRKVDEEDGDGQPSRSESKITNFPAGFFSDPTRTFPIQNDSDEENEIADEFKVDKAKAASSQRKSIDGVETGDPQSNIDREWAEFQASVINNDVKEVEDHEVFDRATVFAEPELVDELPEGIPQSAIPKKGHVAEPKEPQNIDQPRDEAEELSRRQVEERELIMDRLVEEERLQEEADERVSVLKARLALIRQRRMLAKKSNQP